MTLYSHGYFFSASDLIPAFVILSNSKQILPTELQQIAADMFQMEAALFVPSGSMSNLIAGELALCLSVKNKNNNNFIVIFFQ